MANKREVDELKLPPDPADALEKAKGDVRPDAQEIRGRSDDAGPSHESREACLDVTGPAWPKHKIFLSHSGVQKDFTERLCLELERVHHFPFFDRRGDSLRKGERFYSPLMTAAQTCRVAVLVLSEEFFTASKWPMMELNEFVKAQKVDKRVKVLPLYFQISREELGDKERQARWIEEWKVMASQDASIDVKEWEDALRQIAGNNGMPYGGNTEGEAGFIDRVVEAVCRLLPSDVQWDVSHVRSMNELSQPILRKFEDVKPRDGYNVQVVGVYGMGGGGKTTISRAICNEVFGDFVGKVCYIELGKMKVEELLKIVLKELTDASSALLKDKHHDQLLYMLKERIHRQKVFLVLDNVLVEDQRSIAEMFLDVRFCDGSMVLVTSRSLDMLEALEIPRGDCLEMPNLEEESAVDMFLHYSKLHRDSLRDEEWKVIRGCVQECYFLKSEDPSSGGEHSYHYLPLALKVLGIQLRSNQGKDVFMWEKKLGELRKGKGEKFNLSKDGPHPIFSVLRLGYDSLCPEEQHIFLDLALFWPIYQRYKCGCNLEDWLWMSVMHEKTEDEIQASVNILQRKGLLETVYKGDELKVSIHDLYKEFAEAESQGGPFEGRHSLVNIEAADRVPKELVKHPPNGWCWPSLKRLVIWNCKVRSLSRANLRFCKNVELLDLRQCEELEVVDVTGMDNLRCVIVFKCSKLREWKGLEELQDLVILRFDWWHGEGPLMPSFLRNLSSLTALRVLELNYLSWSGVDTFPPDLSACTNLEQLIITAARSLSMTASGVQYCGNHLPESVLKIDFSECSELVGSSPIRLMSSLTKLQELSLRSCKGIRDVEGVCELTSLQKLDVAETNIRELPGNMRRLKHLQVVDVSSCRNLSSLGGISQCGATLRRLDASGCWNLRDLPDDISCFQKLETVDLSWCRLICTLPKDYERLAGGHPRNGSWTLDTFGCFGLVAPLVEMLRLPEKSHVNCGDPCNFGGDSMQSWIDGRKHVSGAAYEMLRRVFPNDFERYDGFWSYMVDEGEVVDFVIRALCEHDDRDVNGTHWLVNVVSLASNFDCDVPLCFWWMVVMTAPCTFGVVMERAKLSEPWSKTLVHYTISSILPTYVGYVLFTRRRDHLNRMGEEKWLDMAIKTLLEKCKENLEKAIVEGILPLHSCEGKKVVDIILGAVHTAEHQGIVRNSILWCDFKCFFGGGSYAELFPNFPFEETLRNQQVLD